MATRTTSEYADVIRNQDELKHWYFDNLGIHGFCFESFAEDLDAYVQALVDGGGVVINRRAYPGPRTVQKWEQEYKAKSA